MSDAEAAVVPHQGQERGQPRPGAGHDRGGVRPVPEPRVGGPTGRDVPLHPARRQPARASVFGGQQPALLAQLGCQLPDLHHVWKTVPTRAYDDCQRVLQVPVERESVLALETVKHWAQHHDVQQRGRL